MSRLLIGVLVLCSVQMILAPCLSLEGDGNTTNLSLEQRIAVLEENLTLAQRQLDIVLKRTATIYDQVEELDHRLGKLQNNVTWLLNFAVPSAPAEFRIESIRKSPEGNYTVTLRWKNGPDYMRINRFVIWRAKKGETTYGDDFYVNQTGRRFVKAELTGFATGDEMVFKIFAKNDAGQSKPSYLEARIRSYAPVLMWWIKILSGVGLMIIVAGALLWMGLRRARRQDREA
jgi:hypothetical protein